MKKDSKVERWAASYEKGLRKSMSSHYFVMELRLKLIVRPGEYWFFHPGLYNLRWWWEEAIAYARILRESVIECLTQFEFLKTMETLSISNKDETLKFSEQTLSKTAEKLYVAIEDCITRMFSFREKISWICYEIISSEFELTVEENKISYFTIKSHIDNFKKANPNHDLLNQVSRLFNTFCGDDFNELFKFRSGFVHRYRPQLDKKQPRVVLFKNRKWDSADDKEIKTRNIVHLISCGWRTAVTTTLELSKLKLGAVAFKLRHYGAVANLYPFNPIDICHNGYASEIDDYIFSVCCMNDCRGFKFKVDFKTTKYNSNNETFAQKADEVCDKIINYIPSYEIERYKGIMTILLFPPENRFEMLVSLEYEQPPETFKDLSKKGATEAMENKGAFWLSHDLIKKKSVYTKISTFKGWPEKAVHAFVDAGAFKKVNIKSLKKRNSIVKDAVYFILLDGETIDTFHNGQPFRTMATWTEILEEKNSTVK